jgi:hypothetical protein
VICDLPGEFFAGRSVLGHQLDVGVLDECIDDGLFLVFVDKRCVFDLLNLLLDKLDGGRHRIAELFG